MRWLATARGEVAGLVLVTVLAGVLRFYRLGYWSFWRDETYTLLRAIDLGSINLNYPIWYLVTHFSVSALGVSEWSARLPAAIVGTLAVPLTYSLLRPICKPLVSSVAVLFIAVSPWHLYWSQNARFYILLSLLTSAALLVFYIGLERDRPKYLAASFVLFGLGVLTHPTALYQLGAAAIYFLLVGGLGKLRRVLGVRNLVLLAVLAALPLSFFGWRVIAKPQDVAYFLSWATPSYLQLPSAFAYYLGVPLICMGAFSAVYLIWRRDRFAILMSIAAIVPLLATVAVSGFTFTASRYMFVAAVPWMILAAHGASELLNELRPSARWLGVGVVALLIAGPLSEDGLYYLDQNGNRWDYRSAYDLVRERMQPGDLIFASSPEMGVFFLPDKQTLSIWDADLAAVVKEGRRAWYVTDMRLDDTPQDIREWVSQHTVQVADFDVHIPGRVFLMRVYLFDPSLFGPARQGNGPGSYEVGVEPYAIP